MAWLDLQRRASRPHGGKPAIDALWVTISSAVASAFLVIAAPPVAEASMASTANAFRVVRQGESIQAALDAVAPGGTVVVQPGEYRENLELVKAGVTLQGHGAVLRPPVPTQPRRCSVAIGLVDENPLGICVAGELEPGGSEPVVKRSVTGVTVRGMTVRDFPVTGLVIYGGEDTRIEDNELAGGHAYGLLSSVSTRTVISNNRVSGGDSAGIYIGSSPGAEARVSGNRVSAAGLFGIYIRNASHGSVAGNVVDGACIGLGFIATRPARGTISDWHAAGNLLRRNNRVCQVGVTLTGTGVLLGGTDRITITHNVIHDNTVPPGTGAPWGGGIVLADGSLFGGPPESVDTRIAGNLLYGNQPYDITILGPNAGSDVEHNICTSSSPANLCQGPLQHSKQEEHR